MRLSQSIAILLLPLKAMACGLDWSEPVSHFENVDFQGKVHVVRKLGEVNSLPIYLIFNSGYGISPYVGSGFEIPFLESRMWQVDESRFMAVMPTGWIWHFQRTKDPAVLDGSAGWKALLKDDTITTWAPCGDKVVFKNGRIASMQLKNGTKLVYSYRGNRVEAIQENGEPILKIQTDQNTGEVTGIKLNSSRSEIRLQQSGHRPKVQDVSGIKVVGEVEKCLETILTDNGIEETFEFFIDDELRPALKTRRSIFVWNPINGNIIKDGDWNYYVNFDPISNNLKIERKNAPDNTESLSINNITGTEIRERTGSERTENQTFMSGALLGKPRNLFIYDGQIVRYHKKYYYNQDANLSRIVENNIKANSERTRTFDNDGSSIEVLKRAGSESQIIYYNKDNEIYAIQPSK